MERPEKLNNFLRAVLSESTRNNLVELCKDFNISESEMNECLEYLRSKEGMNIKDI